jgi:cell division protein FtsB
MSQLDLGKLELIRRWSQYLAAVVLVIFVGLIVISGVKLHQINTKIDNLEAEATRKKSELESLEKRKKELEGSIANLSDLNEGLSNASRTATEQDPGQYLRVRESIEGSILKDANPRQIPARIYLQIGGEEQRKRAAEVVRQLQAKGYIVPGIENVGTKARLPHTSQLRYYQTDSVSLGDIKDITESLGRLGVKLSTVPLSSTNVRPRHYEIWFGQDF